MVLLLHGLYALLALPLDYDASRLAAYEEAAHAELFMAVSVSFVGCLCPAFSCIALLSRSFIAFLMFKNITYMQNAFLILNQNVNMIHNSTTKHIERECFPNPLDKKAIRAIMRTKSSELKHRKRCLCVQTAHTHIYRERLHIYAKAAQR